MAWNQAAFGMRLKALREQKGLSMLAFGKEIGTSASRIKHWEEGKSAPSASWIVTICERFGVSAESLLTGETASVSSEPLSAMAEAAGLDEIADSFIRAGNQRYGERDGREKMMKEITERLFRMDERDLRELLMIIVLKSRNV
ncbi:helix-turn-helix domain-containing protein [Bhargavaea beijingensis]|uniref:DNA-binding transcriptional regulator, XRE-family HTH domain n=1 Tax=Bhargavaea beijingensis TaxID=426756 RepID=A0A1G7ECL8_9BACL|nr:helix-turn-helix transcriptional regulator [Bhargavaea beijingensis]MCW1928481.1 helix-turn-helix domain-containing protein [Bhargavaea beijingensis]RSK25409.1 XRE family transcriptional regulator [Bhargavaea beijingensis]SDE61391.1 DNA-binding transcriptional regulator, XRE-family HTH domain [Bhargavaea beijingensis]